MPPLYEFECKKHGVFETTMTLAEYDKSKEKDGTAQTTCPECQEPSKRVITKPHMTHPSWRV